MKKEDKILIFDFGQGDIKALLAGKKEASYEALAFAQENLIVENNELFIKNSSLACKNIWEKMQGFALQKPKGLVLGLPPSFVYSVIVKEKFERPDQEKEIDQKELDRFENELKKSALHSLRYDDESANEEFELLGISFESFSINGYGVKKILGSKGSAVEISALVYFISESDKDFINHILIKNFSLPINKILYSPLEVVNLYKFSNPSSYVIIVYAGHKSSEVFLINKQSIIARQELNIGWPDTSDKQNFFLHELEMATSDMNIFGYSPNNILVCSPMASSQAVDDLISNSKLKEKFNIRFLDSGDLKINTDAYQKTFPAEDELYQNLSIITLNENLKNYEI